MFILAIDSSLLQLPMMWYSTGFCKRNEYLSVIRFLQLLTASSLHGNFTVEFSSMCILTFTKCSEPRGLFGMEEKHTRTEIYLPLNIIKVKKDCFLYPGFSNVLVYRHNNQLNHHYVFVWQNFIIVSDEKRPLGDWPRLMFLQLLQ